MMIAFWVVALRHLLEMMAGALQRDPLMFLNGVAGYSLHFGQLVHEGLKTAQTRLPVAWQARIVRAMTLTLAVICLCVYAGVWLR
jgi:membrane protein DedA with SNARE-associated domain